MEERKDGPAASIDDAAQRVRDAASGAAKDVKHAALQGVEDARTKAGETGHSTASRLRDMAGQIDDLPWMATAFRKSADGLDNVTDSLTRGDMNDCLSGVSEFAKRQPAVFLGASVALGFALARVGKAALEQTKASPRPDEPAPQPFDGASTTFPTPTGV